MQIESVSEGFLTYSLELPLRFLRDRLLYFDFVVMDLYAEYLLETLV